MQLSVLLGTPMRREEGGVTLSQVRGAFPGVKAKSSRAA